jgi:DNA repair protein RecN (Recombination protein N)
MLQTLSIRDFVIVDRLDLEFEKGLTVLTGETGAGKSILIDALSLALGARGESGLIRSGAEKAEITALFYIHGQQALIDWMKANEVPESENDLIFRRMLYADGRSRAWLNGQTVTIQQLREAGDFLVDIYSQNAHHSLLKTATQRAIFDEFCGLGDIAHQTAISFRAWKKLEAQQTEMEKNLNAFQDELARLRDTARELKGLELSAESWEQLQQEHHRLSNGASLITGCESCREMLAESDQSVSEMLRTVHTKLMGLQGFDVAFDEALGSIDSALIHIQELDRFLNRYLQKVDLDPNRLQEIEMHIGQIHAVARKYRIRPEEIANLQSECSHRIQELESFVQDGELEKQVSLAYHAYQQLASALSEGRQKNAPLLSQKITQEMQNLSLGGGQFKVQLTPGEPTSTGLEEVEFLVAGHIGAEARPLNKVASGGELSRISLAIRVTTAQQDGLPTMIFDEVDVGIGGAVAEVVGRLLKELGARRQVLVITHLPQVAAQGMHHLHVKKIQRDGHTFSHIDVLSNEQRVEEIARMLGGLEITQTTLQHAKEMLAQSL